TEVLHASRNQALLRPQDAETRNIQRSTTTELRTATVALSITRRSLHHFARKKLENRVLQSADFLNQPSAQKISSVFQKIMVNSRHPAPPGGAARDRHGRWQRDAVDAMGAQDECAGRGRRSRAVPISRHAAPTLGPSSWVMIPRATVANKPRHRGEYGAAV